jgi:uncharacterized protein
MIKRDDALLSLKKWSSAPVSVRKPLLMLGARQVGKTSLVRAFAKESNLELFECNFELDPLLKGLFEGSLEPNIIISKISLYYKREFNPDKTLLFFDEVQLGGRALTSLKYFCENSPEILTIAAGSLLGIALSNESSFPVGKVHFFSLYPLTFHEFLNATGNEGLKKIILQNPLTEPLANPFHEQLLELLKIYFIVGGMPEVVAAYIAGDPLYTKVRLIQQEIINGYNRDFSRHAGEISASEIRAVWDSIPSQLAGETSRFYTNKVEPKIRTVRAPVQWLIDAGVALRSHRVGGIEIPFASFRDQNVYKLYLHDVGLLSACLSIEPKAILNPSHSLLLSFRGVVAENYVAQELTGLLGAQLYFWASSGKAELDFLLENSHHPVGIEVKAGMNPKAKSLTAFISKYPSSLAVRCSLLNFRKDGKIHNLPLYAVPRIFDLNS